MTAPPPERDDNSESSVDAAFNDIVGRLQDVEKSADAAATNTDDAPRPDRTTNGPPLVKGESNQPTEDDWSTSSSVGGNSARSYSLRPEDDSFVPPEPPPLRLPGPRTLLSGGLIVGVPLFFLYCALFWQAVPRIYITIAAALLVGGVVVLIMGLADRDEQDPTDDGARF